MSSTDRILEILKDKQGQSAHQLSIDLGLSRQRVHRILKKLLGEEKIIKIGSAPKVLYQLNHINERVTKNIDNKIIEDRWILIDHIGRMHRGFKAFEIWCDNRSLPVEKTIIEYEKTLTKYERFKDETGLINGTEKLKNTKNLSLCITEQYYHDFYAIERFGKTKLGQLIHFGKMTQSKLLIDEIVTITKPKILALIEQLDIDAIGYIPPTLNRQVQIMKELERGYNLSLPIITLQKIRGEIVVPQKALSKLKDRIANAQYSIFVNDNRSFHNVLLIDDALGSGATINETACKIIKANIGQKVYGYAITGSYKGFEVISEA